MSYYTLMTQLDTWITENSPECFYLFICALVLSYLIGYARGAGAKQKEVGLQEKINSYLLTVIEREHDNLKTLQEYTLYIIRDRSGMPEQKLYTLEKLWQEEDPS